MIGRKVLYSFGSGKDKIEGSGVVIDKVRFSEPFVEEGKTAGVRTKDIYMIELDDKTVVSIHPFNIVRTLDSPSEENKMNLDI